MDLAVKVLVKDTDLTFTVYCNMCIYDGYSLRLYHDLSEDDITCYLSLKRFDLLSVEVIKKEK